jgi:hypothetical protein
MTWSPLRSGIAPIDPSFALPADILIHHSNQGYTNVPLGIIDPPTISHRRQAGACRLPYLVADQPFTKTTGGV